MKEDVIIEGTESSKEFKVDKFTVPTEYEEQVLQQAICSGLLETTSRKCPTFDAQGNEIKMTNKSKVFYES